MEKKTSFMALVYREYCITKKSLFGCVVSVVMTYGLCIMYSMSAKFGNIAKVEGGSELADFIKMLTPMVRIMGIMFSFLLIMFSAGASEADLKNKTWALYRKSSPVRPLRLAMARIVCQLIGLVVSTGVSILYLLTDNLVSGKSFGREDIGAMAAIGTFVVLMGVSMTVCVEFMRSVDKGMIMAMGIIYAVAMAVVLPNKPQTESGSLTPEEFIAMIASFADKAPLFIAMTVLIFVIEAVSLTLLYKRRDK